MHAGVDDIKKHKYFATLDWEKLYTQVATSPYVPKVSGPGDCRNFDSYAEEPVRWYGDGTDKFGDTFVGF